MAGDMGINSPFSQWRVLGSLREWSIGKFALGFEHLFKNTRGMQWIYKRLLSNLAVSGTPSGRTISTAVCCWWKCHSALPGDQQVRKGTVFHPSSPHPLQPTKSRDGGVVYVTPTVKVKTRWKKNDTVCWADVNEIAKCLKCHRALPKSIPS